jgi:hypothetical protein
LSCCARDEREFAQRGDSRKWHEKLQEARSMFFLTNSKIASLSLAKATSVKRGNSSKREQVMVLQTSGNVSRLCKKNNKTYKKDDSFSRHFSTYTVLTVRTPIKSSQIQIERDPGCQYALAREEDPFYEYVLQDMHEGEDYYHASST